MIEHFIRFVKPLIEPILKIRYLENIAFAIEWSFKLWFALSLIIPLTTTTLAVFFSILGGFEKFSLEFWRVYYYDGYLCGFIAWRIHLGILFMCFLYMINKVIEE